MSNAPTCRNCQHATWVLTPCGKIKQQTPGECKVFRRVIWPLCKASKCPGFVRKKQDDSISRQ